MIAWPTPPTTFERWASELRMSRPDIDIQPLQPKEKEWQKYANAVNQSAVCQTVGTPRAEGFKDWRSWATSFIRSFGQNS
jgi:hypothetical protein